MYRSCSGYYLSNVVFSFIRTELLSAVRQAVVISRDKLSIRLAGCPVLLSRFQVNIAVLVSSDCGGSICRPAFKWLMLFFSVLFCGGFLGSICLFYFFKCLVCLDSLFSFLGVLSLSINGIKNMRYNVPRLATVRTCTALVWVTILQI